MLNPFSHAQLFVTLWTATCQAPLSLGFSRQEYWSWLPFPSPGHPPDPGIESESPALQADSLPFEVRHSFKLYAWGSWLWHYFYRCHFPYDLLCSTGVSFFQSKNTLKLSYSPESLHYRHSPPTCMQCSLWLPSYIRMYICYSLHVQSLSCVQFLGTPWTTAY